MHRLVRRRRGHGGLDHAGIGKCRPLLYEMADGGGRGLRGSEGQDVDLDGLNRPRTLGEPRAGSSTLLGIGIFLTGAHVNLYHKPLSHLSLFSQYGRYQNSDGNLIVMAWTPPKKAGFVREFLASGLTQAEFCSRFGNQVAPRTLRAWIRTYARPPDSVEEARRIVANAIASLQAILLGLEAAARCQEAAGDIGDGEEGGAAPDREPGTNESFGDCEAAAGCQVAGGSCLPPGNRPPPRRPSAAAEPAACPESSGICADVAEASSLVAATAVETGAVAGPPLMKFRGDARQRVVPRGWRPGRSFFSDM